jgi:hypothetical protein
MIELSENNPKKVETAIEQPKLVEPNPVVVIEQKEDLAPKSEIEYILNTYCLNNNFRSFVISHIFNHLRYVSSATKIDTTTKTVIIPILFDPFYYSLNYDYIVSIFKNTFVESEENVISFNQKKILENIVSNFERQDSEVDLINILLIFIFYCYLYYIIATKHPDFDFSTYFNPELQQSALTHFFNQTDQLKDFNVSVLESVEEKLDDDLINNISIKYKHLIPVSETDFLDRVINEYQKSKDDLKDITISSTKILDLDLLLNANNVIEKIKAQDSPLINTNTYNTRSCASSLLNYEQKDITKAYKYFKEYVSNPTTLVSLLSLKELPVPKTILNLFDFFSRNFPKLFINDKENNTLNYYKILRDNLPSPKSYSHQIYLYLIYNLIIPYHYENFKITKYTDVFL